MYLDESFEQAKRTVEEDHHLAQFYRFSASPHKNTLTEIYRYFHAKNSKAKTKGSFESWLTIGATFATTEIRGKAGSSSVGSFPM